MSKKTVDSGSARWKIQTKLPEAGLFRGMGPASIQQFSGPSRGPVMASDLDPKVQL